MKVGDLMPLFTFQFSIAKLKSSIFSNLLLEWLQMGMKNKSQKWTIPIWNWNLTLFQLVIFFEGKLDEALNI